MKQNLRAAAVAGVLWSVGMARAAIVSEPAVVDLGRRAQNAVAETKVTLVNSGKDAVTIYDVSADCSCTAGTPAKQTLGPGERTDLSIRTETRMYQGEITRQVILRTSDGDVVVPVKMAVTPYEHWELRPGFLTLAPSARGKPASGTVRLLYLGDGDVTVSGFSSEPAWVTAEITSATGKERVIELKKKPSAPAGHHMVKVTTATSDAVNPQVAFNVFMSVESAVRVVPAPLVLPAVKAGKETRLKAEILGWDGDLPPRLELTTGTATVLGLGKEGIQFEIAVTPEKAGALTQLLRVYRGEELELEVAVILRAE